MRQAAGENPTPPFPDPDDPALRVVVQNTVRMLREGEIEAEAAILYAAVHGWYEGHLFAVDGPASPHLFESKPD